MPCLRFLHPSPQLTPVTFAGLNEWEIDAYMDQGSVAQNHSNQETHLMSVRRQPWQEDELRAEVRFL